MAAKTAPSQIKLAIYDALLRGDSARAVAGRFDVSHPTALKYADEALVQLRAMPEVKADPELNEFLAGTLKLQCYSVDPAICDRIRKLIAPAVQEAEELISAPKEGPTVSISARLPESLFYQFKRLTAEANAQRKASAQPSDEVTISSLLTEMVDHYVSSGKMLNADIKFKQSDLLMDDLRAVLSRHGLTHD